MRRRLERRKAVSILHSAADQVAVQVREKARKVRTTMEQTERPEGSGPGGPRSN